MKIKILKKNAQTKYKLNKVFTKEKIKINKFGWANHRSQSSYYIVASLREAKSRNKKPLKVQRLAWVPISPSNGWE